MSIGSPGHVLIAVHGGKSVSDFTDNAGDAGAADPQTTPAAPGPGKMHRLESDTMALFFFTIAVAIHVARGG